MIGHKVYRRIAAVSKNGQQRQAAYRKVSSAYRAVHKGHTCEFPGCKQTTWTIHHLRGRLGMLLIAHRYFRRLCPAHHSFVHSNPQIARRLGLLAQPGEWNTMPQEAA